MMQNQNDQIKGGTTVCLAILTQSEDFTNLYIANVGDSFAMMINPLKNAYQILSQTHNLECLQEINRVESSGGIIINVRNKPRINGQLAITRAIGNAKYKNIVISYPYISHIEFSNNSKQFLENNYYLLLSTDGLLEAFTYEEINQIFMEGYKLKYSLQQITSYLCEAAIQKGSKDNLTAMIIDVENAPKIRVQNFPTPKGSDNCLNQVLQSFQ